MPSPSDRTGSRASGFARLGAALELAGQWAGPDRLAMIVSGSHAGGVAVWVMEEGHPVSLSDLDVYVVVPDAAARDAARARARAGCSGLSKRLLVMGLAAPLEVGFHTPEDLERLPGRPGTLELRRHGRVVEGDPAWLARVPAWGARDVSGEEVLLLLENRAFELLWAECLAPEESPLTALRRRHAILKCALDLASVMALAAGEYQDDAPARVAWARPRWDRARSPEPPWDEALAWREGDVRSLAPEAAEAERTRTVRAWVATWRRQVGDPGDRARPFAAVTRVARRARLRRRLRCGLLANAPGAHLESRMLRLRRALDGTPEHRLHAAAAARLILESARAEAAERGHDPIPELARDYQRNLRGLGVPPDRTALPRSLVEAWDRGLHDGQRTEGWT